MSKTVTTPAASTFHVTLGWALATLLRDYQKQVEAALSGLPGGARAFLVMSLVQAETCHSQIAIADRLSLDKTMLTYLLDGLEKKALIKRTTDPSDRRSRHINLTKEGLHAVTRFAKLVSEIEHRMLSGLGADGALQFQQALMKVAGLAGDDIDEATSGDGSAHVCKAAIGADRND